MILGVLRQEVEQNVVTDRPQCQVVFKDTERVKTKTLRAAKWHFKQLQTRIVYIWIKGLGGGRKYFVTTGRRCRNLVWASVRVANCLELMETGGNAVLNCWFRISFQNVALIYKHVGRRRSKVIQFHEMGLDDRLLKVSVCQVWLVIITYRKHVELWL